jgi:hypothetical protein
VPVLRRLLLVAFYFEVGVLLMVLPWSSLWRVNYFLHLWPALVPVVSEAALRGAVSGLGLLNLFAGFAELGPFFAARARR